MFETVIAAMLKHKQIVFAAIAVTALIGYVMPPAVQVAQATIIDDVFDAVGITDNDEDNAVEEEEEDDDGVAQDIAQDLEQEQSAETTINQPNDQSEENDQENSIETGHNTATATQDNDNEQTVVSGDAAASARSEAENSGCDCHDKKHEKHHSGSHGSDDGSGGASSSATATAVSEATGSQDNDNAITQDLDSSVHDVSQTNVNRFGDDENEPVAISVTDQDQRAAQIAAQLGIDFDFDNTYGYAFTDNNDD
jgi:hypothetical protein